MSKKKADQEPSKKPSVANQSSNKLLRKLTGKNPILLGVSILMFLVWLVVLGYLAFV